MGKEARVRRLRKLAAPAERATYTFHITDREAWALVMHLLLSTTQKDASQVERLLRCFEEFGLQEIQELVQVKDNKLGITDFDPNQFEVVSPARDTVDYVIEMCNREMMTLHALPLALLVRRLKQVQAGTYELPGEPPGKTDEDAPRVQ